MSQYKIIYDIVSLPEITPEEQDFDLVLEIFEETNILIWDSSKQGERPFIVDMEGENKVEVALLDLSSKKYKGQIKDLINYLKEKDNA